MSQCTSVSEQSLSSEDNAFFGNLSYYILDKVITCIKETHKDSPMAILKTVCISLCDNFSHLIYQFPL